MNADLGSLFVRLGGGVREVLVPINAIKGFTTYNGELMLHLKDDYVPPDGLQDRCVSAGSHRTLKDVQEEINKTIAPALRESNKEA